MNFLRDASSSPLRILWALSRHIIDWHSLEEEPVCSSPAAHGSKHRFGGEQCLLRVQQGWEKKSALMCLLLFQIHISASPFFARQRKVCAQLGVSCSCSSSSSSAQRCHSAHYFKSLEYYFTRLETAL